MGSFNDLEGINDCDEGIDIEKKEFVGYGYNDGRIFVDKPKNDNFNTKQLTEEEICKNELSKWLSHPNELGQKPFCVEYTNSFVDEDGISCMIYKFKKDEQSKWLLGIVSDSGTFSEMREYNKESEINDAKAILNMLKEFWKKMANDINKGRKR